MNKDYETLTSSLKKMVDDASRIVDQDLKLHPEPIFKYKCLPDSTLYSPNPPEEYTITFKLIDGKYVFESLE